MIESHSLPQIMTSLGSPYFPSSPWMINLSLDMEVDGIVLYFDYQRRMKIIFKIEQICHLCAASYIRRERSGSSGHSLSESTSTPVQYLPTKMLNKIWRKVAEVPVFHARSCVSPVCPSANIITPLYLLLGVKSTVTRSLVNNNHIYSWAWEWHDGWAKANASSCR